MEKRFCHFLACCLVVLLLPLGLSAQVKLTGAVFESDTHLAVVSANVLVKKADGKIAKFGITNGEGKFSLALPQTEGCTLEVTMMGFKTFRKALTGKDEDVTVLLVPGSLQLNEVTVKADRIREQGDTITYHVGAFAKEQDRSIGEVLNRMPGIDVDKTGKIKYQGEEINKFYIEGSDLLGGKYGIATNGISKDDVGAVEVMKNHQPLQVLSGLSFSDKAAINLKLKDKAKAAWSVYGDAAGGYAWQPEGAAWEVKGFAMAVMPSFQHILMVESNNTGQDLSSHANDFFSSGRNTGLTSYVSLSLPGTTSLGEQRTLFNRSLLFSSNSLWKVRRGEVKAQIDYAFNRTSALASNVTTYFLSNGNRVITEDRQGVEHAHSLTGKFIYELNQKTTYVNNTLQTNLDWDDLRIGVTGTLANSQTASLPDYYLSNHLKMIRRYKERHLITFESKNEWESLPQTLTVDVDESTRRQHVSDRAFYTQESLQYAFTLKGVRRWVSISSSRRSS